MSTSLVQQPPVSVDRYNFWTRVDSCCVLALLVYEYYITLNNEVKYIWRGRYRSFGPLVLFLMNRYSNLLLGVYQLVVLNPAYHRSAEVRTHSFALLLYC